MPAVTSCHQLSTCLPTTSPQQQIRALPLSTAEVAAAHEVHTGSTSSETQRRGLQQGCDLSVMLSPATLQQAPALWQGRKHGRPGRRTEGGGRCWGT